MAAGDAECLLLAIAVRKLTSFACMYMNNVATISPPCFRHRWAAGAEPPQPTSVKSPVANWAAVSVPQSAGCRFQGWPPRPWSANPCSARRSRVRTLWRSAMPGASAVACRRSRGAALQRPAGKRPQIGSRTGAVLRRSARYGVRRCHPGTARRPASFDNP